MTVPTLLPPRRVAPDTFALTTHLTLPGLGVLPVNAFLIEAKEPVLVDTGIAAMSPDFLRALGERLDPADLRWIWLTHTDLDHVGSLRELLRLAPRARLVTTFLGMGKLGLAEPIPPERLLLLNPGQELFAGDRSLLALRPPTYDAPETTALFDSKTRTLFSADAFGALLDAPAESARAIAEAELRRGLATWASVDAPWLSSVRREAFQDRARALLDLGAETVLSSHLPPAPDMLQSLLGLLDDARSAPPFVGPDQQALIAMLSAA